MWKRGWEKRKMKNGSGKWNVERDEERHPPRRVNCEWGRERVKRKKDNQEFTDTMRNERQAIY
jgi:hypothetical protein